MAQSARARGKISLVGKDPFCPDAAQSGPPRQVGYIRVSTAAQITDRQVAQLDAVCSELHIEYVSGAATKRPVFDALRAGLRRGDTLVVSDLDRAFRSAVDAILTAEDLRSRGVHFRIQRMHLDTDSLEGELFFNILAAFAQFERRIISRRTREGLAAARRRGVRLGRPALLPAETVHEAHAWIITDRASMLDALTDAGFDIPRSGKA
ncbi:recombinase family protein [Maritalea sp.]|uniref:recombinase family protein n=1 Tax=Maritalea sp. TaxID=2003361 RepID=UPI003EF66D8E